MADKTTQPSDTVSTGDPLAGLTDEQLSKFELTGELPADTSKADDKADEAKDQADPQVEAAATDADATAASAKGREKAADPESAKPEQGKKKLPGQKKSARERADEINAEAAEEERLLEEALTRRRRARDARRDAEREDPSPKAGKKDAEAAAATTDPKAPAWKRYREMPDAPKSKDFDDLDDYAAAMGVFVADKIAEERANAIFDARSQEQRAADEEFQSFASAVETGMQKAAKELESDPDIVGRIDPRLHSLKPMRETPPDQRTVAHYIKEQCLTRSNNPLKMLAWLSANDSAELRRIGRLHPEAINAALTRQDARFDFESEGDEDTTAQDEGARDAHAHRKSKAPAPAPTLGKKPSASKDPRKAPDSYDDFDSWNLEETKAAAGARG